MNKRIYRLTFLIASVLVVLSAKGSDIKVEVRRPTLPVLAHKDINPTIRLDVKNKDNTSFSINEIVISLDGTRLLSDIESVGICKADEKGFIDTTKVFFEKKCTAPKIVFADVISAADDSISLWVFIKTKDNIDLGNRIYIACSDIVIDEKSVKVNDSDSRKWLRPGVALRQEGQDQIAKSRIPGLATSKNGTLLAIYDARWDGVRDLQGDIDIALQRSFDGGRTWQPIQIIMDMGEWGGLPQKYNGSAMLASW